MRFRISLRAGLFLWACGFSAATSAQELVLGPALNGAWHVPEQPGQGLLVDSTADGDFFFGAWFTYQAVTEAQPGAQRWWTVEGPYDDEHSDLVIYLTTGGEFLGGLPASSAPAGTARVSFPDCGTLVLEYDFDGGDQGSVEMERLLPVPDGYCDGQMVVDELETTVESDTPVVFRDVSVVSMVEGAPLVNASPASVLVSDGLIQSVGVLSPLDIPAGAVVIDGRGRFLMPGLVDTHTHLAVNVIELLGSGSNGLLNLVGTNQLQLYLANGVTTIVNLGDFGEPQTQWAAEIEAGTRIGPRHLAGKYARGGQGSCDGGPPQVTVGNTAQDGRKYVQAAVQEGYRFIKIYNCTPPGAVDGILAEAGKLNIPVAGHFPVQYNSRALLLDPAFSLLAHANAFLFNGYLSTSSGNAPRNLAIASMVEGGTAMSTGMWIVEVLAQIWCHNQSGYDSWLSASPIELMHFTELELHQRSFSSNRFAPPGCSPGDYNGALAFSRDIIRRALDAGVEVVTGTDSPTVFGVAGFSMHSELQALRRAGLSDAEALATATGNAGRYLARVLPDDVPIGRVAPGHRADLLLLDRSPGEAMDDFPASLELVMAGGAAYPRLVRDAWLERIRNEYNIQCPPYCRP